MECKGEKCDKFYSCNYLQHRFQVKECDIGHEIIVNAKHLEEMQNREDMLKGLSK